MLSIKCQLKFILQRAILTAFPIKEEPVIEHASKGKDLFNFDYICYSPKLLFEKYKRSNSFYGLFNEKAVAEDIRGQIPNNEMISKVDVAHNGSLEIKLNDQFIMSNMASYKSFILSHQQKAGLICLPSITNGQRVDYEIFRAINVAEKLQRVMGKLNYKTKVVFPIIDQIALPKHALARLLILTSYESLMNNRFFQLDHDILLSSNIVDAYSGMFKSMAKDFENCRKEKQDLKAFNLSLLINFLRIKYEDQHNLVVMTRASEASSIKQTIDNQLKQNSKISRHYKKINQFYYGGLLLQRNGRLASDRFIMEDIGEPKFERITDYITYIDKVVKNNLADIRSITGRNFKTEDIFKSLDIYSPCRSTQNMSNPLIHNFLTQTFFLILQTYRLLKIKNENFSGRRKPTENFEGFGRAVAVKLLRYNEVMQEMFNQGDVGHVFHYWEDLAMLWYIIFETGQYDDLSNKGILLENTLLIYDQFLDIFFGAHDE